MSFTVVFASLKGGVGRTTLAANVAATLLASGRRCVAIDLDPQDALALHFGLASETVPAPVLARRGAVRGAEAACLSLSRGAADPAAAADPAWVRRRLEMIVPPTCEITILDAPATPGALLAGAVAVADLVVAVMTPDAACFATLPALEELLARGHTGSSRGAPEVCYVMNRVDATSALARDVLAAARATLGSRLLPQVVHEDEAIPEALAHGGPLLLRGGDSQAVADLNELAERVSAAAERKGRGVEGTMKSAKAAMAAVAAG